MASIPQSDNQAGENPSALQQQNRERNVFKDGEGQETILESLRTDEVALTDQLTLLNERINQEKQMAISEEQTLNVLQ